MVWKNYNLFHTIQDSTYQTTSIRDNKQYRGFLVNRVESYLCRKDYIFF